MGRITVFLLVFLVCSLALRVLLVDSRGPEELEPLPKVPTVPLVLTPKVEPAAQQKPPAEVKPPVQVIDVDPDLDQSSEPPDCQGTGETPPPNEPAPPIPH